MSSANGSGGLARTLAFYVYLVVGTIFWGTIATLVGGIPPRGNYMFFCARRWSRGLLRASGVRVRVESAPDAPSSETAAIYLANHSSLFDIPVLIATLPGQTRFLAKRSLFRIPIFGWALAIGGFVPVDRGDRRRAREALEVARARLAQGASILLFPEETRSPDGRLLRFKRGGFVLALRTGAPLVPVGIEGTFGVRSKGSWRVHPGTVTVRYGAPVSRPEEVSADFVESFRSEVARLAGQETGPD